MKQKDAFYFVPKEATKFKVEWTSKRKTRSFFTFQIHVFDSTTTLFSCQHNRQTKCCPVARFCKPLICSDLKFLCFVFLVGSVFCLWSCYVQKKITCCLFEHHKHSSSWSWGRYTKCWNAVSNCSHQKCRYGTDDMYKYKQIWTVSVVFTPATELQLQMSACKLSLKSVGVGLQHRDFFENWLKIVSCTCQIKIYNLTFAQS